MSTKVLEGVVEKVKNVVKLFSTTEPKGGKNALPVRKPTRPNVCFQFFLGKGTISKLQNQFKPGKPRNHDTVVYRGAEEEHSELNLNHMGQFTNYWKFLTIFFFFYIFFLSCYSA